MKTLTLGKRERLSYLSDIRTLFNEGRSIVAFPIRAVYIKKDRAQDQPPASILVSVPKRHFKHAVDRNRVKRQIREAFRQNKELLLLSENEHADIAFVWLDDKLHESSQVEKKLKKLLTRLSEICKAEQTPDKAE